MSGQIVGVFICMTYFWQKNEENILTFEETFSFMSYICIIFHSFNWIFLFFLLILRGQNKYILEFSNELSCYVLISAGKNVLWKNNPFQKRGKICECLSVKLTCFDSFYVGTFSVSLLWNQNYSWFLLIFHTKKA